MAKRERGGGDVGRTPLHPVCILFRLVLAPFRPADSRGVLPAFGTLMIFYCCRLSGPLYSWQHIVCVYPNIAGT